MLWYKAWLDTRWRFLIGLGLLTCVAVADVLTYPAFSGLIETATKAGLNGPLVDEVRRVAQLSGTFRGYIWVQFVDRNLPGLWMIFAVLYGAQAPLSSRAGAVFTLALPVSRRHLCAVRMTADLVELCVLALFPMLLITLMAPAVGQSYGFADALVHGMSVFSGGAVFYCLALLLAAGFNDRWRPILITLGAAVAAELGKIFLPQLPAFSPAAAMSGDAYFRTGALPWAALMVWLAVAAALLYSAMRSIELRDF